jgi:hypothetical protein
MPSTARPLGSVIALLEIPSQKLQHTNTTEKNDFKKILAIQDNLVKVNKMPTMWETCREARYVVLGILEN